MTFTYFDWAILLGYFFLLIYLTIKSAGSENEKSEKEFLLSGRRLTLPAFIATLVSTWYGGILGVGEYSYQFGISQWLLFGFPFYVFAWLYARYLSQKIRDHKSFSLPEALRKTYSKKSGYLGALGIFLLVSPAPYILMLGVIVGVLTGGDNILLYSIIVAVFSAIYVSVGGFRAVVKTDLLQIVLMYGGFIILIVAAWNTAGSPQLLWANLPDSFKDLTGGNSLPYIFVWFFIALWTFVDPSFHQRVAAAKNPETAKRGIYLSIFFWFVFDSLTLLAGLYAWYILGPDLVNPVMAYPELAIKILGPGLLGLFFTGLVAVVMSTLDSFLFLSGQTLGRDILKPMLKSKKGVMLTRLGIIISLIIGVALTVLFPSVIDLWYVIGTLVIPAILVPVLGVYLIFFRIPSRFVDWHIILVFATTAGWLAMGIFTTSDMYSYAWLGIEPFYAGLAVSVVLLISGKMKKSKS